MRQLRGTFPPFTARARFSPRPRRQSAGRADSGHSLQWRGKCKGKSGADIQICAFAAWALQCRKAARESDNEQAYRNYLEDHPNGAFVEDARARLDDLDRNSEENAVQQRARSEEAALGLNPVARRLAEARLADLGLNPGAVDGTFDKDTRRAIRRYQDARQLPVSGYLDRATAVRLMADTFLR